MALDPAENPVQGGQNAQEIDPPGAIISLAQDAHEETQPAGQGAHIEADVSEPNFLVLGTSNNMSVVIWRQ